MPHMEGNAPISDNGIYAQLKKIHHLNSANNFLSLIWTILILLCWLGLIIILIVYFSPCLITTKNDSFKKVIVFVVLVFQIVYKSDYTHDDANYNYPVILTPSYQTTRKLDPLKDVNNLFSSLIMFA